MPGPWEDFGEGPSDAPWKDFAPASLDTSKPGISTPSTSWSDVGANAVSNLPASAYNIGKGIVHSVAHPIETAQNLYGIEKGGLSSALSPLNNPTAQAMSVVAPPGLKAMEGIASDTDSADKFDAVKNFYAKRYGSLEGFKQGLSEDPAGILMDMSTVLSGGEMAAARLPGVAGRAGQIAGKAAGLVNPVNLAAKAIPVAGKVASNVLGLTSGLAPKSIEDIEAAAYRGSDFADKHMRPDQADPNEIVDMARSAMGQVYAERARQYKADMASTNANKKPIDYMPIHKAVRDAADSVQFKGKTTDPKAAKAVNDIAKLVTDWHSSSLTDPDFSTAIGLDKLKQAVGGVKDELPFEAANARRVAGDVYSAIRSEIVKQDPTYAKAMLNYSDASDNLNEMSKALSLNNRASYDTALRKLLSTSRNNANTNYGARTKTLDQLAKHEPDLPAAIAGQAANTWLPRGLARIAPSMELGLGSLHGLAGLANPVTLATLPMFSPRVVGELASAVGKVRRAIAPPSVMRGVSPVAAAAPKTANLGYAFAAPALAEANSLPAILPEDKP